jgi:uncharacterized membrane protein
LGKKKGLQPAIVTTAFAIAILLAALPTFRPDNVPVYLLMAGRFHPLVLHFPIVLVVLALVVEGVRRKGWLKQADTILLVVLAAAAVTTLISVLAGFLLFASGEYAGVLMDRHFLAGAITGAAVFLALAFFLLFKDNRWFYPLYVSSLLIGNGAMAWTGHLGGSITHGEGYLTEYLPFLVRGAPTEAPRSEEEMLVYEDMIAPILDAKCMSCHNAERAKGRFRMTSLNELLEGGESGKPGIVPGDSSQSEAYQRVILPPGHSDRMPPEGKTPMSANEIVLLGHWIQAGADAGLRVADARQDSSVGPVIASLLPELARYRRKAAVAKLKVEDLREELKVLARKLEVIIEADTMADGDSYLLAMKFPPAPFTNDQFRELAPYSEVFSRASLVASGIDDAGLYYISRMVNLRILYLQKTRLDGSGLIHLQKLPRLEVLNLSFTKVDDKAALDLLNFPALKTVYLHGTNTSPEVVEALRKYRPGLDIRMEEGPYL